MIRYLLAPWSRSARAVAVPRAGLRVVLGVNLVTGLVYAKVADD